VRVVFLDRDGVINRNPDGYVTRPEEFEFLPGALEALRRLRKAGIEAVVVSNQACVGKELLSEAGLREIDRLMVEAVETAGGRIRASYYCTHLKDEGCECRKPAPGLILRAAREQGIDPARAVFVGDAPEDVRAGKAAGCRTAVVLSGRITEAEAAALDPAPDAVVRDLREAVEWIIAQET
jgi:histidinol-phosphate phosphatase family protein